MKELDKGLVAAIEEITGQANYRIEARESIETSSIRERLSEILGELPSEDLVFSVTNAAQRVYAYNSRNTPHCLDPLDAIARYVAYAKKVGFEKERMNKFCNGLANRIAAMPADDLESYVARITARLGYICFKVGLTGV